MSDFSTPDLYDKHGEALQVMHHGLMHFGLKKHMKGQVVIVQCPDDNSLVAESLKQAGDNKILVVDALDSKTFAFLGDNLALFGIENQWAGVVINGCVRDVEILKGLPFCVMALGHTPRKTQKQGKGQYLEQINLLGAKISKNDWLYADENGIVISSVKL